VGRGKPDSVFKAIITLGPLAELLQPEVVVPLLVAKQSGGLLHHLFTLAPTSRGGLFSVTLFVRFPLPGSRQRRFLPDKSGFKVRTFLSLDACAFKERSPPDPLNYTILSGFYAMILQIFLRWQDVCVR